MLASHESTYALYQGRFVSILDEHVNSSLLHQARVCSGLQCLR